VNVLKSIFGVVINSYTENAPFCVVSVKAVIFKLTEVKQECSVLPIALPIQICLLLVCLQVACSLQGCSKCQSKRKEGGVQCLITSLQCSYK